MLLRLDEFDMRSRFKPNGGLYSNQSQSQRCKDAFTLEEEHTYCYDWNQRNIEKDDIKPLGLEVIFSLANLYLIGTSAAILIFILELLSKKFIELTNIWFYMSHLIKTYIEAMCTLHNHVCIFRPLLCTSKSYVKANVIWLVHPWLGWLRRRAGICCPHREKTLKIFQATP